MKASVIIPTYNRADLLQLTLASLVGQDIGAGEYEVIVIDDGSADSTRDVALSFQEQLNMIYYFQEDLGFRVALARNQGIGRAHGAVLIFVDTGMIVGTSFIRKHFECYYDPQNPETCRPLAVIGYVYGYDYNRNSGLLREIDYAKTHPDLIIERISKSGRFLDIREPFYQELGDDLTNYPAPWALYWTTNVSVESTVMRGIGGFDESFVSWGMEDSECAYRLYQKGVAFALAREAAGIHYPHEREDDSNFKHDTRNRLKCLQKHPCLEMELYCAQEFINFNLELQKLNSIPNRTPILYSAQLSTVALQALSRIFAAQSSIVFGCQEGLLLEVCQSQAGLETDSDRVNQARTRHYAKQVLQLAGVRTPFEAKSFETALLAGSTQIFPEPFLTLLTKEARRIAKKVYWLRSCEQPDIVETLWHKVEDLGNGLALYEMRWRRINRYSFMGFTLALYSLRKRHPKNKLQYMA